MRATLPLRLLRWPLLSLYAALVLGFLGLGLFQWELALVWLALATVVSQGLFIWGAGTVELSRPIRGARLLLPVAVAAAMMALLAGALGLAMSELFYLDDSDLAGYILLGVVAANWVFWALVFLAYCHSRERYQALARLTAAIFAGSLVVLLASIPAHMIVSRRPGCFVGLSTFFGVAGGVYGMLWAFGPGIILLFLKEKRRHERRVGTRAGRTASGQRGR